MFTYRHYQHNLRSAIMTWHSISIVNPPISTAALIQNISIFVVLFSKLNENRTEIMCQNLFTRRIVQNVVQIIILFVFFSAIASKYVCQVLEKTLFSSVFYFLGLRDPHFQKLDFLFVRTIGYSFY